MLSHPLCTLSHTHWTYWPTHWTHYLTLTGHAFPPTVHSGPLTCLALIRTVAAWLSLTDRVQVMNSDIVCQPELVSSADVVVLNNVFQFFLELDKQADMWRFLRSTVKPGAILVTIPALHQVLVLDQAGIDLSQWVEEIPLHNVHAVTIDKEDLEEVKHYRVK
uniref:Methyltransferase type 11 domain-containing protein n=1 Tax=Timema monikensis TaxID=170555 RepID=A0A7R9DYP2_9NEOP|nr:unnamed protein product [Timema monikensis]